MSTFMLKSVGELVDSGMTFFIPDYQRGYRWEEQQVTDLLNDILEASENGCIQKYCLQPLVVTGKKDHFVAEKNEPILKDGVSCYLIPCEKTKDISTSFEVIDGQQRLTTIFIIIKYLYLKQQIQTGETYTITYETRGGSEDFLKKIDEKHLSDENIDYYHMSLCYQTVKDWFEGHREQYKKFEHFLRKNVYFIWYEDDSDKPVETFTRLNIGKIALTNAELIKAMLLKQSNFESNGLIPDEDFRLSQLEMANQWDEIEFTLQKDEFWYFIHPQAWEKPTRIDFIFELIKDMNFLNFDGKGFGNDSYTTFRYFYQYLRMKQDSYIKIWDEVRRIFQIFREWFNDASFYHYIGFLTNCDADFHDIISNWSGSAEEMSDKEKFRSFLIDKIKVQIKSIKNLGEIYSDKTKWRPLLLLFNVQTAVLQNNGYSSKSDNCAFYKFPFQLFRKEKWDIEHVDSFTENDLGNVEDQVIWVKMVYLGLKEKLEDEDKAEKGNTKSVKQQMLDFLNKPKTENFESMYPAISVFMEKFSTSEPIMEKNSIGNFVLLDAGTNRGYGNAIFPAKRMTIIGKDQGKIFDIQNDLKIEEKPGQKSFIPPCTRNVFMKYYTPNSTDIMSWNQADADAYTKQIYETLQGFDVQMPITVANPEGE